MVTTVAAHLENATQAIAMNLCFSLTSSSTKIIETVAWLNEYSLMGVFWPAVRAPGHVEGVVWMGKRQTPQRFPKWPRIG